MKFKEALRDTFPIFISYFALSFSFGIVALKMGMEPYLIVLMSIIIYSGSLQFLLITIYKKLSLIDIFLTSFLLNFRQFFYSLTFLERYKNSFYKIFALTDETYALLTHKKEDPKYDLYVSILNQSYWVFGTICGVVFAKMVNFELKGLDFILVCLFVVILVENFFKSKNLFPFLLGVFTFIVIYALQIPNILLFSILLALIIMIIRYKYAWDTNWRISKCIN